MSSIRTGIELQDNFSPVLDGIMTSVSEAVSGMEQMQQTLNAGVDTSAIASAASDIDDATASARALMEALQDINAPVINLDQPVAPPTMEAPVQREVPFQMLANPPPVAVETEVNTPAHVTVPVTPIVEQPTIEVPDDIVVPVIPEVTEQPVITTPEEISVPVTPVVTEQPNIEVPDGLEVDVTPVVTEQPDIEFPEPDVSGVEQYQNLINLAGAALQQIVSIQERINSQGAALDVLPDDVQSKIAETNAGIRQMQSALDYMQENPFDLDAEAVKLQFDSLNASINQTLQTQKELDAQLQGMNAPPVAVPIHPDVPDPLVDPNQPPVTVPVEWQGDFEVFTSSWIDRFNAEVQSTTTALNTLNQTQQRIEQAASGMDILPDGAAQDISNLGQRLQWVTQRIQQIQNNKLNIGTDEANAGLEQLRSQLDQAIQSQAELNTAIESADASRINEAYIRLSQTVRTTETYIRDEVTEQGRFNRSIQQGVSDASNLKSMIVGAVAGFTGIAGVRKAFGFIHEATELFNTQLNAENQLMTVLGNMLDADYVASFELETTADTTEAVAEINAIQAEVDEVVVPVSARTQAIMAEFDAISAKASEIQSKGIYGDESMIAAGAELATYFSDVEAITTMMDTLSNYAMGMSGGGAIDTTTMVDYATNLGKIMTGAYDAMTKKGFEFTDAQKAIIEGSATQDQLLAVLGEDYASLSADMQAVEVISQIINDSWGNLYETMSNTPEGEIIQMTNAWGDMKELIGRELYPYVLLFVHAITDNWGTIEALVQSFAGGLEMTMGILSTLLDVAFSFAQVIMDNWSWIAPIIYGIAAALMVYYGAMLLYNTITGISTAITTAKALAEQVHAAALAMEAGATFTATAAQYGFNAALLACPITWIILAIIAVIALIYAVCSAIAKMTGVANTGFGVITGGINVTIAFFKNLGLEVANIALGIGNALGAVASNMMAAFSNAISSVQAWFYNLLSTAMTVIAGIAEALNKLPFVEFDYSGITAAADNYAAKAAEAEGNKQEYQSIADAFNKGMSTFDTFQSGWASDAFKSGAAWGDGLAERFSDTFDPSNLFNTIDVPTADQYAASIGDALNASGMPDSMDNTAGNTGAMADALDITKEELKYLRDIAEQEAINRYTTAEITIEQTNNNTITSNMDLDGVVDGLTSAVNEAVDEITEGVHD